MGKLSGLFVFLALIGALIWQFAGQPDGTGTADAEGDDAGATQLSIATPEPSQTNEERAKAASDLISGAVSGSVAAAGAGAIGGAAKPGNAQAIAADTVEEEADKSLP